MTGPEVVDALVVSQSSKRQLPMVGFIAAILCAYVLFGAFGVIPPWVMWLGVAVFGAVALIGLYGAVRALGRAWDLRLDRAGVTVRGHPTRAWSDFAEVR